MDVLSIHYHPEFHAANLYNDLAIVKLDGVVDFQKNPHISPICLPDSFQVRNLPNAKLTLIPKTRFKNLPPIKGKRQVVAKLAPT